MESTLSAGIWIILLLCFAQNLFADKESTPIIFSFPEYQYKETPKNEITFREFETACEQSRACSNSNGIARARCIRECVSPSCYREIYYNDQLEDGEIDVRLNSFKGCFVQKSGRQRN